MGEDYFDFQLSSQEVKRLDELDSTLFGFINLSSPECCMERVLVTKAIKLYERKIVEAKQKASSKADLEVSSSSKAVEESTPDQWLSPQEYCKLGHVLLLIQDFARALSAYQLCYSSPETHNNCAMLYGYGLVCFHFNKYSWAKDCFQRVLYRDRCFVRANEVHIRLGIIFKQLRDWDQAFKHFKQALIDSSPSTFSKAEIRFHIAHCFDIKGDFAKAKDEYNSILSSFQLPNSLKALIYRQLGWLHCQAEFGEKTQRTNTAIQYLQESLKLDSTSGQTYYYLGRCYSSLPGRAHDAFLAYRHSIDKSESSADTWCSIGTLYQQQNQFTDALQAFICAVQLDKSHKAAWIDLGLLYEHCGQPPDAVQCYRRALETKRISEETYENLKNRIEVIETASRSAPAAPSTTKRNITLPSLEEAWKLPIPAELTTRQDQIHKNKMKQYLESSGSMRGCDELRDKQPFVLSQQQFQMLQFLQQNQGKLNAQEASTLKQLQHLYLLQQQQQQQQAILQQKLHQQAAVAQFSQQRLHQQQMPKGPDFVFPKIEPSAGELPQFTQEDIQELLGTGDGRQDDDIFTAFHDPMEKNAPLNDPILTAATIEPQQENRVTSSTHDIEMFDVDSNLAPERCELRPPPPFSMDTSTDLDLRASAAEIIDYVKKRSVIDGPSSNDNLEDIFGKCVPPELPIPEVVSDDKLLVPTPSVIIESKKDALSPDLMDICFRNPIVLVKSISVALKLDLGLFSTKTLVEKAPNHQVELRTQLLQSPDTYYDNHGEKSWVCPSRKTYSTIQWYAKYQAASFRDALKDEQEKLKNSSRDNKNGSQQQPAPAEPAAKLRRSNNRQTLIRFGTNVDLSDAKFWHAQLKELDKLPAFCRVQASSNMLSHLGYVVLGMNTVQLYMKIPGCRTPGHQENNNFASVNINIGPGDCEWFAVDHKYWGVIKRLCEKHNINFLTGAWWPLLDDLAKERVPVYRFTQKPGDLVWVTPGTVHWVQSLGWCNNIAWNVGPCTALQLKLAIERYEFNKVEQYRSIVPLQHLCFQLAQNLQLTDAACTDSDDSLVKIIKTVLLKCMCYSQMMTDYVHSIGKEIKTYNVTKDGINVCEICEAEIFNFVFGVSGNDGFVIPYCFECARKEDFSLSKFYVLIQYDMKTLMDVYDSFKLHKRLPGVLF